MVYYYCSAPAFQNIVKNKKLWLSDISKSNDRSEIMLFVDMVKALGFKVFSNLEQEVGVGIFDKSKWHNALCREVEKEVFARICLAMCFSQLKDDLSQWRGYGDDGRGFCIGFDEDALANIKNNHQLSLKRIKYRNQDATEGSIKQEMVKLEEAIRNAISRNGNPRSNIENSIRRCVCNLVKLAPRIKDEAFSAEQETRLYYWGEIDDIENLEVRFKGDGFVPCIELDVSGYYNLIKEIYIGPTNNGDVDILKKFCTNYNIRADVKKSRIAYRSRAVGGN